MNQSDEVREMLGEVEPNAVDAKKTVEKEETPVEKAPEAEILEVEPEAEEEEQESEAEPEISPAMKAMQDQMENMTNTLEALTTQVVESRNVKADVPEMPAFEYTELEAITSDENFDEVIKDRKSFNELLNLIAEYGASKAIEHFNKVMPGLVGTEALKAADSTFLIKSFWRDNKDIAAMPKAREIATIAYRKLEALNPGMEPEALFAKLGDKIRRDNKMATPAGNKFKQKKTTGFAPAGGGTARKAASAKTTISDELAAMENIQ